MVMWGAHGGSLLPPCDLAYRSMRDRGSATDAVLVTDRLTIRRFRDDDLDALAEMYADPEVMRFLGGPRTREDAATRLGWMIEEYESQPFGMWGIALREQNTLIGRCGIIRQELIHGPEHEIAYLLGRPWWGRGYATEAAAAVRDHARDELGLGRLVSLIDHTNFASQAVARRIGMVYERDVVHEGHPVGMFVLEG